MDGGGWTHSALVTHWVVFANKEELSAMGLLFCIIMHDSIIHIFPSFIKTNIKHIAWFVSTFQLIHIHKASFISEYLRLNELYKCVLAHNLTLSNNEFNIPLLFKCGWFPLNITGSYAHITWMHSYLLPITFWSVFKKNVLSFIWILQTWNFTRVC